MTPTGAAIVATLAEEFLRLPGDHLREDRLRRREPRVPGPAQHPARLLWGAAASTPAKQVYVIETTIDDATPQVLARFLERALELGALDAFLTPVVMKKGRLATKLTLLAEADRMDALIEAVFRETSSIGVRFYPVGAAGPRAGVPQGPGPAARRSRIKVSRLGGEAVNVQPEYEDCLRVAAKTRPPSQGDRPAGR